MILFPEATGIFYDIYTVYQSREKNSRDKSQIGGSDLKFLGLLHSCREWSHTAAFHCNKRIRSVKQFFLT